MRMRLLLCLFVCGLLTKSLAAADYKSPLGFVAKVPSGWVLLTAAGIRDNKDLFDQTFVGLRRKNPERAQLLKDKILNGEQDVILRIEPADVEFVDNINILRISGNLPTAGEELANFCKVTREQLRSSEEQDPLKVCEAKPAGSNFAILFETEGSTPGTTVLQYQVQCSRGLIIAVTAVSKAVNLLEVRKDLYLLVASLRCNS